MSSPDAFDVVVVGGGPAGSVMAWSLARRGVSVAVVERATFPREKVCGDFVEPGGLRILEAMDGLRTLSNPAPLPIDTTRVYFGHRLAYHGDIPYYQDRHGLPPHGYIVPRHVLDTHLLALAQAAGATVFEGAAVRSIERTDGKVRVGARSADADFTLTSLLVVGADGTESTVARRAGLWRNDRGRISISQRAYVEGVSIEGGEAAIWFDEDLYPGYGWMFPMSGGRANVGVGMLSETLHRRGLSVTNAFAAGVARLKIRHPGCTAIEVASRPMGGVVKMYGAAGPNHFDGGLLIGDAGSFVDPMTGEGITQGMESAVIASRTVLAALECGRFDAAFLSRFERDFRTYFDPSMLWLDFCAVMMRNWHFREFWLRTTLRGFERATADPEFARVSGASFGGLDVQPLAIIGQIWSQILGYLGEGARLAIGDLIDGRGMRSSGMVGDVAAWERGWRASLADDAAWHHAWLADLARSAARLQPSLWRGGNPRVAGPLQ